MKKFRTGVLLITLAIITLIGWIFIRSIIQGQAILAREPLTVDELDRLAAKWGVASQDESSPSSVRTESSDPRPDQIISGRHAEARPTVLPLGNLPDAVNTDLSTNNTDRRPSLTRTISIEARKVMSDGIQKRDIPGANQLSLQFTASLATTFELAGVDDGAGFYYYDTARTADLMGDWQTAKQYYGKALNYPLSEHNRQSSLISLAKLEDDLLVADRLLDLACPTDRYCWVLYDATDLALRTGSEDLFYHYLARLRVQQPEIARQFDRVNGRPEYFKKQKG